MPIRTYKAACKSLCSEAAHLYLLDWEYYEMNDEMTREDAANLLETRIKLTGKIEFVAALFNKTPKQVLDDVEAIDHIVDGVIDPVWFKRNQLLPEVEQPQESLSNLPGNIEFTRYCSNFA